MARIKKILPVNTADIDTVVPWQPVFPPAAPEKTAIKQELIANKESIKILTDKNKIPTVKPSEAEPNKPKFKKIHKKDVLWLENDIYQTINNLTNGKKGSKALIVNKALKDYFKKNKIPLQAYSEEK